MKNPWIWLWCAAAGIVVGFILGRGWSTPEAPESVTPPPEVAVKPAVATAPVASATPGEASPPSGSDSPGPAAQAPPADPPSTSPVPMPGDAKAFAPPVDSGVVNSVDAGEVFNRHIARTSTADHPNQLGDAHRAFEREPRDDGWAYSMEAELQNSMLNETSMGAFKMEHVECRTTICEVRISGTDAQGDAVRDWSNGLHSNNFNQQLLMNVSSTIASHGRVDAIYIFRRPAR